MKNIDQEPKENEVFRFRKDLSQMKRDKNNQINVWNYEGKCWCNPFELSEKNAMYTKIEKGEWKYLFEYEDEDFDYGATNLEGALCKFLDNSWGNHYVKYLEELGFKNMNIDAIDTLKDEQDEDYCLLQQKLCNGSVFQVEVWANDDGTYHGLAQEICLDLVS